MLSQGTSKWKAEGLVLPAVPLGWSSNPLPRLLPLGLGFALPPLFTEGGGELPSPRARLLI